MCFTVAVEYLKTEGANVISIQIPELEESRIAHGVSIGAEMTFFVENGYPDEIEKMVRHVPSALLSRQRGGEQLASCLLRSPNLRESLKLSKD